MPERAISMVDEEWLLQTLAVNTVGPGTTLPALFKPCFLLYYLLNAAVLMAKALAPFMRTKGTDRPTAVIANLSARVGSIGDNKLGGWYSYRMSKAALNQATRTMAIELGRSGTMAVSLHPGTVDTGMSKPFSKNVKPDKLFTTAYSASCLLGIIDGLQIEDSGAFFGWDGQRIEW